MILRDETGAGVVEPLWNGETEIVASWLVYTEAFVTLEVALREGRLTLVGIDRARTDLDERWSSIDAIAVIPRLAREAGMLGARHGLRTLDAVHLATALAFDDEAVVMATWDRVLRRASLEAGLAVVP